MYDDRRGGGSFSAFLLGGIVGAVLALMYSPRSGRENREMVKAKANEYWNQGLEMYETGRERATDMYETGRERATEMYETGRERATEMYESATTTASEKSGELRAKIDAARERLKGQVAEVSEQAQEGIDTMADKADEAAAKVEQSAQQAQQGPGSETVGPSGI